jgi:hypothetical protein
LPKNLRIFNPKIVPILGKTHSGSRDYKNAPDTGSGSATQARTMPRCLFLTGPPKSLEQGMGKASVWSRKIG